MSKQAQELAEVVKEVQGESDILVEALKTLKEEEDGNAETFIGRGLTQPYTFNHDYVFDLPDHWVSMMRLPGFEVLYPFHVLKDESVLVEKSVDADYYIPIVPLVGAGAALKKAWETLMPDAPQTGGVYLYRGIQGNTEVIYIRYEQDHVNPVTFTILDKDWDYFIRGWNQAVTSEEAVTEMEAWCKHPTSNQDLVNRGWKFNFTMHGLTYSLKWFLTNNDVEKYYPFDQMDNGDFEKADNVIKQLDARFDRYVADISRFAFTLKDKVAFKDHDLMLAFKANEKFTGLVVSLDKIYPKFPEGGAYECGVIPVTEEQWANEGDNVKVVIRRIVRVVNKTNELIDKLRKELPNFPYFHKAFEKALQVRLMSSSHFMKEIYKANPSDIQSYVQKVGNDVVMALNKHGGNIGLDLTSWVVYQYMEDGSAPVPVVVDELNFKQNLFNTHTERFMDVLYQYLLQLRNPYIRPYAHRVAANITDGIPVGSIRPLNPDK